MYPSRTLLRYLSSIREAIPVFRKHKLRFIKGDRKPPKSNPYRPDLPFTPTKHVSVYPLDGVEDLVNLRSLLARSMEKLKDYSSCDVADALLKLEETKPRTRKCAGYLEGINPFIDPTSSEPIVGIAYTVQFQPKDTSISPTSKPAAPRSNIPMSMQWSDGAEQGSIVVVQQPEGQLNAAAGGIHALRLDKLGVKALLVDGRVRDRAEMAGLTNLAVWSKGASIVGAAAECKAHAVQVPVEISGVLVQPGDIIMCDPIEGAVRIPAYLLDGVLRHLARRQASENAIKQDIRDGMPVQQAFVRHR